MPEIVRVTTVDCSINRNKLLNTMEAAVPVVLSGRGVSQCTIHSVSPFAASKSVYRQPSVTATCPRGSESCPAICAHSPGGCGHHLGHSTVILVEQSQVGVTPPLTEFIERRHEVRPDLRPFRGHDK